MESSKNADQHVIADFGNEWSTFDQSAAALTPEERHSIFQEYFRIFPWAALPKDSVGFDLGCGSGRWAVEVVKRVGHLHCIDPSRALEVAKRNLTHASNATFHQATVDAIPLADASMDFGYSLGVLHHVPDTAAGIAACVRKLKPGAPFLCYLYYAFDNQPWWFRGIWRVSDGFRRVIAAMPAWPKQTACEVIAATVYWPLAKLSAGLDAVGVPVHSVPLSNYRNKSFYSMRTDALDRFGTRLEQRFTQAQMRAMMEQAGLVNVAFSTGVPFWCAVGFKRRAAD